MSIPDFEAWRCTHEPAGENMFCPPEGCPKNYGCARQHGWKPGDPTPAGCQHTRSPAMTPSSKAKVLSDAELKFELVAAQFELKIADEQIERLTAQRDALKAELALKDKVVEASRIESSNAPYTRLWWEARHAGKAALNDLDKVMP